MSLIIKRFVFMKETLLKEVLVGNIRLLASIFPCLLFFNLSTDAQYARSVFTPNEFKSPYQFSWKKDTPIIGTSLAAYGAGIILQSRSRQLNTAEILNLNRSIIPRFDRIASFKYSSEAAGISSMLFKSSYVLPSLFLLKKDSKKAFGHIFLLYQETILLTHSLSYLTQRSVGRIRPFVYNELANLDKKLKKNAGYSFFSKQTAITTANYFLFAKVFADFYPDSKWKPYIWGSAALFPAVTGWLSVEGGKHFYSDVLTGYAVGALIGFMVPHFHKQFSSNQSFSFHFSPTSFGLRWQLG